MDDGQRVPKKATRKKALQRLRSQLVLEEEPRASEKDETHPNWRSERAMWAYSSALRLRSSASRG